MTIDTHIGGDALPHEKELHDMLLKGYSHAIIIACPKMADEIEEEGRSESSGSGPLKAERILRCTPADVIYDFGKEGRFIKAEGFDNKYKAEQAHRERLEFLEQKGHQAANTIQLIDIEQHLENRNEGLELTYE